MLTIRLLGEMAVLRDGEPQLLPPSRKTRALLAYLIATGRPQRRDHICDLLWDVPDDPRGALRWSLSKLRLLVDEPGSPSRIVARGETVAFATEGLDCDLHALLDAESDDAGAVPHDASVDRLRAVVEKSCGAFLEGLDLPAQGDFQAWCLAQREDVRRTQQALLNKLMVQLAPVMPEEALFYARRLVALDRYDAAARSTLVDLLLRLGRHDEARQHCDSGLQFLREASLPTSLLDRAAAGLRVATGKVMPPQQAASPQAAGSENLLAAPPVPLLAPPTRQQVRFCRTTDEVRIAYAVSGGGRPLVKPGTWLTHLEHDWRSPVWQHWMQELSAGRSLVRYDQRGNGLSDWNAEDLSFAACQRDLAAVVETVGLGRFPMLGISQGCASAVAYAAENPDRVTRLVLFGGYARGWAMRGNPSEVAIREALRTLMLHGWGANTPAFRQSFTSLFIPEAKPEQIHWFNELQKLTTSPQNAIRLTDMFGTIQVEALLPRIRVPTLVMHCIDDAVVPFEEGRRLAMGIPGARFVALQGRNHILLEDEPAWPQFLAELTAFLAEDEI
ncbi:alpha/beta fold hydrolase [Pseudoroseomonas globiformis]|uniref:Alpha/beta fold hydrolase n=1 Tax=Teichococcus globiformis TaxID=2307229 RepID=A0ABV7G6V1_9PROT